MDVEYIYFLTRLYQKDILVVLIGPWGGEMFMDDLIDEYYVVGTHSQGGKIPIKHIADHPLRFVSFMIKM